MKLDEIKTVGLKTIKILNNLGLYNVDDLVNYYPYRYEFIKKTDLNTIYNGCKITIDGVVDSSLNIRYFGGKKNVINFRLKTDTYIFNVSIFNRGYLKEKIKIGDTITVIGKYEIGRINATDIKIGSIDSINKVDVIYHVKNGISSVELNKFINVALEHYVPHNYVPDAIQKKYNFIDKTKALLEIHNPTSSSNLKDAIKRLKYEELFIYMLKISHLRKKREIGLGIKRNVDYKTVLGFMDTLPFELTSDQNISVNDIYKDLISSKRMNRLVQGDVGSGKTIVAFIALYINYLSGYQGVLMAPTEVLAQQHFNNIKKYFKDINIVLLTGNIVKKERIEILNNLKAGFIDIIIGTHAVFSDDVIYNNLGLVVTDEQHRFGVNQRNILEKKGINPDVLYLSATPIPRTYALTIYGEMDISNIKTLPSGKKSIITTLKKNEEIKDVLELMYQELKNKHQIYVVVPLVEESDKIDLENVYDVYDKMNKAFSKVCKIGIMHGKLSNNEKDNIMQEFIQGNISILISTTVIEVGVDVKNASMMVIFDSYRFGLSQLHQLRGRVGRNDFQSYCILISDKEEERLKIMTNTNNGFEISEEDFRLRGSGDLFGIRQSGELNFKIANIKRDYNLLLQVKEDCMNFLNGKHTLEDKKIIDNILENQE